MTIIQITAIISLLLAFGVDAPTVENIRVILTPVATTTQAIPPPVPVITTPVVENAPVYFGSTQPAVYNNPLPTPQVVELPHMDEIKIIKIEEGVRDAKALQPFGSYTFHIAVIREGKHEKFANVTMNAQDNLEGVVTYQTNSETSPNSQDWTRGFIYVPISSGDKTITFTSGGLTTVYSLKVSS